jgi:hypothetical protein
MNKVIDKATAHFRNQISGEMKSVTVPEWGDAVIYWKSTTTLRDEGKILELSQAGKTVEALVESLILRARNEDGTKMFGMPDKMIFMNEVDPGIIIRVAAEINNVPLTMDEAEKN